MLFLKAFLIMATMGIMSKKKNVMRICFDEVKTIIYINVIIAGRSDLALCLSIISTASTSRINLACNFPD